MNAFVGVTLFSVDAHTTVAYCYIQFILEPVVRRPPLLNLKLHPNVQSVTRKHPRRMVGTADIFVFCSLCLRVLALQRLQWPIIASMNSLTMPNTTQYSQSPTVLILLLWSHFVETRAMNRLVFQKIRERNVLFLGVQHVYSAQFPLPSPTLYPPTPFKQFPT
jgi:hypothetical protein